MSLKSFLGLLVLALSACQHHSPNICEHHKQPFEMDICQINTKDSQHLHLFWQDNKKQNLSTFNNLAQFIRQYHPQQQLIFAMNAGMYDDNYAPIGHTIINKQNIAPINLHQDEGNFYLKPNGVFYWHKDGFFIEESEQFAKKLPISSIDYATQSGPMLVINGKLHPAFNANSTSLNIRNGVGVNCQSQTTAFVISREPVNFYDFASLFKDELRCQNALFLDGGVASALYSHELHKNDPIHMAVMIGYLRP